MAWQSNYEAIYNSTYGESPWGAASGLRSWSFWWLQTSLLSLFLVLFGWNFNVGVGVDFAGVNWQVDRNYGQNLSGHKSGPGPSMVNSYGQFTPASSDTNRRDMRSHPKKSSPQARCSFSGGLPHILYSSTPFTRFPVLCCLFVPFIVVRTQVKLVSGVGQVCDMVFGSISGHHNGEDTSRWMWNNVKTILGKLSWYSWCMVPGRGESGAVRWWRVAAGQLSRRPAPPQSTCGPAPRSCCCCSAPSPATRWTWTRATLTRRQTQSSLKVGAWLLLATRRSHWTSQHFVRYRGIESQSM